MKSTTEVDSEIRRMVAERVDAGIAIRVDWFTQEILAQKDQFEGEDADFYVGCAVVYIRKTVKNAIGAYEPTPATVADPQLLLEGFDYLQKAYTVDRDGERMLVPVQDLTWHEREARAAELDRMAAGCIKHAIELRGYNRAAEAQDDETA